MKEKKQAIKKVALSALLIAYTLAQVFIPASNIILTGRASAEAPSPGITSTFGPDFGITDQITNDDISYRAEWLDAAHLKVYIGVKGVFDNNKYVMFVPNNDSGGSSPLVDQHNEDNDELRMHVEGWKCYAQAGVEVDGNIAYHPISHFDFIDIDYYVSRDNGCKDFGTGKSVDTINPDMSIAYFRWVDSQTIEPVAGMHIDEAGGGPKIIDLDDVQDIDPVFKIVAGKEPNIYRSVKEEAEGGCIDRLVVASDKKTLKFYDFFDKKYLDDDFWSWDTLFRSSIIDAWSDSTAITDGCAMQDYRRLEFSAGNGDGSDEYTVPFLDHDTNIANIADSTKPGQAQEAGTGINGGGEQDKANCENQGGGLAWLVCTILSSIDSAVTWIEARIKDFLFINPAQFDKDNSAISNGKSQNGVYKAWSTLRGLSTIVIVIIALLMIFSEAMGQGIFDNYSVKKLLPKLIFAGIAVQLSWWLMTTLINVANIIGDGIGNLILNPFGLNNQTLWQVIVDTGHTTPKDTALLTGMVVAGAVAMLFMALGLGIGMLAAVFVALITLVFRNLVIYLGLVFAPIAIALSILPGTQKASKWWWESFEKALMMYPIVVALLASGKIMSFLLLSGTSVKDTTSDATTGLNSVYVIGGVIAWYAPFFLLPKAFQLGGKALGKISGLAGDKSKGIFDKMRKGRDDWRTKRRGRMANMYTPSGNKFKNAAAMIGSGSLTRRAAMQKGGQYYSGDLKKAQEELVAINRIANKTDRSRALQSMALRGNPRVAQAAMEQMLKTGDIEGLRTVMTDSRVDKTALTTFKNANFGDLKAKAIDLVTERDKGQSDDKYAEKVQQELSKLSTAEILGQNKSTLEKYTTTPPPKGSPSTARPTRSAIDASLASRAQTSMTDKDQWNNLGTEAKARLLHLAGGLDDAGNPIDHEGKNLTHKDLDEARDRLLAGPSDMRLKRSISYLGKTNGLKIYSYQYLWSPTYYVGVMAQDLLETHPEAISTDSFGYYHVDYSQLGIRLETLYEWQKHNKYPTNSKTKVRVRS